MPLLPRKTHKFKDPRNSLYEVQGFVSCQTPPPHPFLGSEIKDLLNLDASLMIFKTSVLHPSVAFHFPCAFPPFSLLNHNVTLADRVIDQQAEPVDAKAVVFQRKEPHESLLSGIPVF